MKDIIEMAREAGFSVRQISDPKPYDHVAGYGDTLERFADLVRADERNSWPAEMEAMERQVNILTDALAQEREACAKVCDDWPNGRDDVYSIGEAIRARRNT